MAIKEPIETASITDYINSYDSEWNDFLHTASNGAWEIYVSSEDSFNDQIKVTNTTYVRAGKSVDEVKMTFIDLLESLRKSAICKKLEGFSAEEGKLIFQSRTIVEIYKDADELIRLRWRGSIDRIPPQCNAILMRV